MVSVQFWQRALQLLSFIGVPILEDNYCLKFLYFLTKISCLRLTLTKKSTLSFQYGGIN